MIWSEYAFYIQAAVFSLVFVLGILVFLGLSLRALWRAWRRRCEGKPKEPDRYVQW